MQISDLVASVTQTSTRRKSSLAYPTEAPRAPAIEAKHAAASARAGQLRASFNVHALAAAEEREPDGPAAQAFDQLKRSEEHTSELQSHSFISYAVFCLKKKK